MDIIITRVKSYMPSGAHWRFAWKWLYSAKYTDGRQYPEVTIGYAQYEVKDWLKTVERLEGKKIVKYDY